MALQKMSETVYVVLCLKIGTSQQVAIRREVADIAELIHPGRMIGIKTMTSGSMREGFRFKDSDLDEMFWIDNHKVLWDFSQALFYNIHRHTLILCDSSESPPGFTLLWLPLEKADRDVILSCVRIREALYISSAKHRINACTLHSQSSINFRQSKVHGPCSSGRFYWGLEYDFAHCFPSDCWPPSAYTWINRSHSWPPPDVVDEIVKSGCHFVAIGHKLGKHADNEWRISFSQAEQKLVYAMNHSQFLTYGLLKIFVKEINKGLHEEEKLLCSYHMKTAIFWVIQQNTIPHWCPQNLLGGFWVCFKLLLKWVYEGVCPNFFIPENNMYLNKVYGVAQMNLFTQLYALYEKGIAFLLHIPCISPFIIKVFCNPRLSVCTDQHALIYEAEPDAELFWEVYLNDAGPYTNIHECIEAMHIVEQLLRSPLTECQVIMIQKFTATTLQTIAFILHDLYTKTSGVNKHMYFADKMSCYMLKLAAKFGIVSDLLYIAMYFYKTFRYEEALYVIEMAKVKLEQPGLMYRELVDTDRYTEAVGGQSWSYKMKRAVAHDITFDYVICYINELRLEQQSALQQTMVTLQIPPVITLYMLEFLCCRHVDPVRAQAALDDLEVLVHHDQGVLVPVELRDISWEILGICQQITGNLQFAQYSYQQSLRQCPRNHIQTATRQRIRDLHQIQLHTH